MGSSGCHDREQDEEIDGERECGEETVFGDSSL